MNTELENMMGPAGVARILGITPERVRQLADQGRIPVIRTPLGRLFTPEDVEAFRVSREGIVNGA